MRFDHSLLSGGLGQPLGQPLGTGPACRPDSLPCHKPTTWLTSRVDPRCCTGRFHKFLVASSRIPPSSPFLCGGRKPPSLHRVTSPGFLLVLPVPRLLRALRPQCLLGFHRVSLRGLWSACVHEEPSCPAALFPGPFCLCHPGQLSLELTVVAFLELSFTAIFGWSHHVQF